MRSSGSPLPRRRKRSKGANESLGRKRRFRLRPAQLALAIDAELDLVDSLAQRPDAGRQGA